MQHIFTRHTRLLLLLTFASLLGGAGARAQYTMTTMETGGYYSAVACDIDDNVYVVRYNGTSCEIAKYTNGTGTPTVIYSGLAFGPGRLPWGLAVNAAGVVFVTNPNPSNNWEIIKLTPGAGGTYTPQMIQSGAWFSALGMRSDNTLMTIEYVFAPDRHRLRSWPEGQEDQSGTWLTLPITVHPGATSTWPWGVAIDGSNNYYVLDLHENNDGQIIRMNAAGGYATSTVVASGGFYSAIAIDGDGNFYTTEYNGTDYRVVKRADITQPAGDVLLSGMSIDGLAVPWGLAVNSKGEVFIGDGSSSTGGRLVKLSPPGISVQSVTRADANPTNATQVDYTVTFSGAVSNVTPAAFSLTATGTVSGASVASVAGSGASYTVTVNTGTGDGTLRLNVTGSGISSIITNAPFTNGETYTIDKTAPTGTLSINSGAAATNDPDVTLTITSDGTAPAYTTSFSNDNVTWSAYTPLAASTPWTLAAGDGTKTVYMRLRDAAGNVTPLQDQITLDATAPNTTIVTNPPVLTNSTSATFTFTSSETPAIFQAQLDGGAFTPATTPLTFTGMAEGPHTFTVRAVDAAGNIDATPASFNWTIDLTAPAVSSVSVPANGYYNQGTTLTFSVQFGEDVVVTGTPYLELILGSVTVQAAHTAGSGTDTHTFSYTVQAGDTDMDGIALGSNIMLNGGTMRDQAGNNAQPALQNISPTNNVFVNTSSPTVTLSTTASSPVNQPFPVTITFSEAVTGFTLGDVSITNATLSNLSTTDNITYTATVTPSADGAVTLSLPADAAQNIGNNGNAASNTLNLTYDQTAPAITTVNAPANKTYVSSEILTFTVNYDEAVTVAGGTPSLPITIGSTTVQALYTGGSGSAALTFAYTIQNGEQDANGVVVGAQLQAAGATLRDAAGNDASLTLAGIQPTAGVLVDATAPVVNSVTVPANGYYKANDVLTFEIVYSENVIVTGTPYIEVTIGAVTRQAAYTSGSTGNELTFSYTVQNGDLDMDGIALGGNVALTGGTVQDAAGNNALPALNNPGNTSNVFVNTIAPTVVLSGTPSTNAPFTLTVTFSEAVTGFALTDFTATNATLSNLQTSDNISYTVLVTHTANGAISVPANVTVNIAGNGNQASNVINYTYDGTAPAVTSVDVPANGYYSTGEHLDFTVHFSENVVVNTGGSPGISVTIGSASVTAAYTGGSGSNALTFRYTVQDGDLDMDGIALGGNLELNGASIQDAAGNNALPALNNTGNTSGVFVNTIAPTVVLSGTPSANAPFTLTVTFSEAVTGFALTDFTATNATLSNLQTSDNISYTVLVTHTANGAISVPANVTVNIAGNGNQASNVINYTYDGTAPAVTSVDVPANGYYSTGEHLDFTVHFSENVVVNTGGSPGISVTIGSASVTAAYTGGSGSNALTFRYTVQDGDMDMDGIAISGNLELNGATVLDAAGNNALPALNNAGNTSGVFVNTQRPNVTVTTTSAGRVNTPATVTLTFSEAVSGLDATDISVTNGAASGLQTADNITYTAVVTPAADGAVNVSLPADMAVNIAGNGNNASNTVSFTYDATAPTITAGQSFSVNQYSPTGTEIGQVAATAGADALQNWTIATDGAGGALEITATGMLRVKDVNLLGPLGGTTVTLHITVSDGLNTSAAIPVTVQVTYVNQAPTLDPVANVSQCPDTETHTIQLTGASAVEPDQTFTITATASQDVFDLLTVNASNVLSYQLKAGTAAGNITVTVTIKDNGGTLNGGTDTLRRTFTVTITNPIAVTITSDKGTSVSKGDIVRLTASGGAAYQWTDADGIISGRQSAVLEVRPQANITYEVTATNAAGCTGTGSISIAVVNDFKVDATNILTPNGDGRNDRWVVRNLDSYPNNEVKIFDRAGRMVYQRRNYSNEWDGTLNGSPLAEGTYYYILTINGDEATARGYITIVRDSK